MLRASARLGVEDVRVWDDEAGCRLAGTAFHWERERGIGGDVGVWGDVVVAADADLGARRALRDALVGAGIRVPVPATDAVLIAAAVMAWGEAAPERLDGTWAFVAWDRRTRRLLAARDFSGARTLFVAPVREGILLGSSMAALLTDPRVDGTLEPAALLAAASWQELPTTGTCRKGVQRVRAGTSVVWRPGGVADHRRHYEPPPFTESVVAGDDERAAETLVELLRTTITEQLDMAGPTAVWMSGGYDSTAVFGVARGAAPDREVIPVSVSFPPGDIGREDEAIAMMAARWKSAVHWIRSDDIPLFGRLAAEAERADEPFVHLYSAFNRALARASRTAFDPPRRMNIEG